MKQQKSYKNEEIGILYLVATPIGNLKDITIRALDILKEVDLIAAEDTRQTIKLLNYYEIHKKLISYHEHNKVTSGKEIIQQIKKGKRIALVSDAGMPAISDPGSDIVKYALEEEIPVIPIPGPNAGITGLVASGLGTDSFLFLGFLSRERKNKIIKLEEVRDIRSSLIVYEAPHRLIKTLQTIEEVLGNRNIVIIRELTKKHEEFTRGNVSEIINFYNDTEPKGEITIIIEGYSDDNKINNNDWWINLSITQHINKYIDEGLSSMEAIKVTAKERNISKRDVYKEYHNI